MSNRSGPPSHAIQRPAKTSIWRWLAFGAPILLVNGHFFGYGRISRRKLERHLAETTNALEV